MASDPKKRQKQLAKKKAKRKNIVETKQKVASLFGGPLSLTRQMHRAQSAPIHECLLPVNLFETGIGHVIFARQWGGGEYAVSIFLVDVYCLGIKDAFFRVFDAAEYDMAKSQNAYQVVSPACVRKLVEGAEAYANSIGIKPHEDYKLAKQIFADTDAATCAETYEYGKEGKPLYISGPYDSPTRIRQIQTALQKHCGEGNYHFLIAMGDPSEFDDDEPDDYLEHDPGHSANR